MKTPLTFLYYKDITCLHLLIVPCFFLVVLTSAGGATGATGLTPHPITASLAKSRSNNPAAGNSNIAVGDYVRVLFGMFNGEMARVKSHNGTIIFFYIPFYLLS